MNGFFKAAIAAAIATACVAAIAHGQTPTNTNFLRLTGGTLTGSVTLGNSFFADSDISVGANGYFRWGSRSKLKSPADGVNTLLNAAETDFSRLQFGGTTSSFPGLGRNGAALVVQTADGGSGTLSANLITSSGGIKGHNVNAYWLPDIGNSLFVLNSSLAVGSGTGVAIKYDSDAVAKFRNKADNADAAITAASLTTTGGGAFTITQANSVSPTSPNRTITISLGGTTYYLHAKTTND